MLYTKKDKFATKIVYVQDKILPRPQKLYTGMPVTPGTNSRSGGSVCRTVPGFTWVTSANTAVFVKLFSHTHKTASVIYKSVISLSTVSHCARIYLLITASVAIRELSVRFLP